MVCSVLGSKVGYKVFKNEKTDSFCRKHTELGSIELEEGVTAGRNGASLVKKVGNKLVTR